MALSYLLMISLLVVCAFESGALQTKMSVAIYHEALAFEQAESVLVAAENTISAEKENGEAESENAYYQFKKLPIVEACLAYYDVQSTGTFASAKAVLKSTFAVPLNKPECQGGEFFRHREAWEEVR